MKRDAITTEAYWQKWIGFCEETIQRFKARALEPPGDPGYRPQFLSEIANEAFEIAVRRYSRGDAVSNILPTEDVLTYWTESRRLGKERYSPEVIRTRTSWCVNLDNYVMCFWLTGLMLATGATDAQWLRALAVMGNEGEDALLDRVLATIQPGRRVGTNLCFPQAYQKLLDVVNAPAERQPRMLRAYVEGWYASLKDAGHPSFPRSFRTPYWYYFGSYNIEGGAYFGYWCIEAATVAKVFDIDDALCLDHPHYPGDLFEDGRAPRYPDPVPEPAPPAPPRRWWTRWLARWK